MQLNTKGETSKRKQSVHPVVTGMHKKVARISVIAEESSKHAPAEIKEMREKVSHDMNEFQVNLRDRKGNLVKSMIAVGMAENSANKEAKLYNFNEASVSIHVIHLVQDVVHGIVSDGH